MQNCCVCRWTHTGWNFCMNSYICPKHLSLWIKGFFKENSWPTCKGTPCYCDASLSPFILGDEMRQAVLAQLWMWMCQWWLWFSSKHPQLGSELNSHDVRDNWALNLSQAEKYFHTPPFRQRGSKILFYVWKSQIKRTGNWTFSGTGKKSKVQCPFAAVCFGDRRRPPVVFRNQLQVDSNRHDLLKSQPYQPITHKLPLFCKTTISWHQVFLKRWPTQWFPLISLFSAQLSLLLSPSFLFVPPVLPTDKIAFFFFWCKICQTKLLIWDFLLQFQKVDNCQK